MKPLVIIPARGGSKGLPEKNIKVLGDKPLIQWTIDEARKVFNDNIICVSTDDHKIKNTVEQSGLKIPFLRPKELATDTTPTQDVLLHAIKYYEDNDFFPDVVVLLQPTSPFRKSEHIIEALSKYNNKLDMVVSVKETHSNPYFNLFEETNDGFLEKSKKAKFTRRQDCPSIYEFNGAIYIINIESLKNSKIYNFNRIMKYEMDNLSSIDIDSLFDWKIAKSFLKNIT